MPAAALARQPTGQRQVPFTWPDVERVQRENAELKSQLKQATEAGLRLIAENSALQTQLNRFSGPQHRSLLSQPVQLGLPLLETKGGRTIVPPTRPPHKTLQDEEQLGLLATLMKDVTARHRELLAVRTVQRRWRTRKAGKVPKQRNTDGFFPDLWGALRRSTMPLLALTGRLQALKGDALREVRRLHTKFETSGHNFTFGFAGIQLYYEGLEHFIGSPQPDLMGTMDREHSSTEAFNSHNVCQTTPRAEWLYVTTMEVGAIASREQDAAAGRVGWRISDFATCREAQDAGLQYVEVLGLRLYTGPMYVHYNGVLRREAKHVYVTTIHTINSAIVKLGKRTKPTTVYRGVVGGVLPSSFFEPGDAHTY